MPLLPVVAGPPLGFLMPYSEKTMGIDPLTAMVAPWRAQATSSGASGEAWLWLGSRSEVLTRSRMVN